MSVPAAPFYLSDMLAEWGLGTGHYVSELVGRPNVPAPPFYFSQFAGLSNVVPYITGQNTGGGPGAVTQDFPVSAGSNVGASSWSWSLNTDSGSATIISDDGAGNIVVRLNAGSGYAHTIVSCHMVIAGGGYDVSCVLDWTH